MEGAKVQRECLIEPSTSRRSDPRMQQMMDYQIWKQRHEELLREAEMNRQVRALLATGKRRAGRRSALA